MVREHQITSTVRGLLNARRCASSPWATWAKLKGGLSSAWSHLNGDYRMIGFNCRLALLVVAVYFTSCATHATAACSGSSPLWTAASASRTDVSDCVTAASTGDTIRVPAGSETWASTLSIAKSVSVIGAGSSSTLITNGGFALTNGYTIRISGFGFTDSHITLGGKADLTHPFRIDHNSFTATGSKVTMVWNGNSQTPMRQPYGLFDNNTLYNYRIDIYAAAAQLNENNTQSQMWTLNPTFGTGTGAVYVEDNNVTITAPATGNWLDFEVGTCGVARFNTFTDTHFEVHGVQSGVNRGGRCWEFYHNTRHIGGGADFFGMAFVRAGSGFVFGNRLDSGTNPFYLNLQRSTGDVGAPAGQCNGTSLWDGNTPGQSGYPCRDQLGRVKDNVLWTHTPGDAYAQNLVPAYFWDNIVGASTQMIISNHLTSATYIAENRDYYKQSLGFDGTIGVGVGAIASRPTTCTAGVAYWATDQGEWNTRNPGPDGQLYKCVTSNTWILHYIPYTYPHPLQDLTNDSRPTAPTGLRITLTR